MAMTGWTMADIHRLQGKTTPEPQKSTEPKITKTEREFWRYMEAIYPNDKGFKIGFNELSFRMKNGCRYTPDFILWVDDRIVKCIEVKGGYRLPSHGRSRLAFQQARLDFPHLTWEWWTKEKDGWKNRS